MTKLYQKSEITFAILWIAAYVVLSSADQLSESIGIVKSATAVLQIAMSLILFFWIRSNNLSEKYGFCKSKVPAKYFLYYLPLVIIASTAFWGGFGLQYGFPDTLMYMISMCCVGFLEEVIFRDSGYICRSGRIRARAHLLLWKIAGSVYHFPFSK